MSADIYGLKLHETVSTDNGSHSVTRVPGGWLYHSWRYIAGTDGEYEEFAATFVPFDNGFQDRAVEGREKTDV